MSTLTISSDCSSEVVRPLTEDDIYLARSKPTSSFVAEVVERVVRCGSVEKPGVLIIPNTYDVFATKGSLPTTVKAEILTFQRSIMKGLRALLEKTDPSALRPQNFLQLPHLRALRVYRSTRLAFREFNIDGLHSDKFFHMDPLAQIFVSLCYGPYRNVHGGYPLFVDMLKMAHEHGTAVHELLDFIPMAQRYPGIYHPRELEAKVKAEFYDTISPFVIRVPSLHFSKLPLIFFTNRVEDGIMHGATRATRKRADIQRVSRPVSYCAIGHRFNWADIKEA